jgi:protein gp37
VSDIEWTDRTWNPIVGCTRVSPGCEHCYAERFVHRGMAPQHRGLTVLGKGEKGPRWTGEVRVVHERLEVPISWKKPARVFVNSLSDLFHDELTDIDIAEVFAVMARAKWHTFQVLTKRPERMRAWFEWLRDAEPSTPDAALDTIDAAPVWPLPNVWLGVTAEDQQRADERIPLLLDTPAAVRFVSYEPALGPVTLRDEWLHVGRCRAISPAPDRFRCGMPADHDDHPHTALVPSGASWFGRPAVDWLIVGGESGHGARPFDLAWARSAVEQCNAAGVRVFVKQFGAKPIDSALGDVLEGGYVHYTRSIAEARGMVGATPGYTVEPHVVKLASRKGNDPSEWPAELRVREFPT